MKKKLLLFFAFFCIVSFSTYAQFRIGTTDYNSLSNAVAAVPTTGTPTTIEILGNYSMSTAVTISSGQHVLLKSVGGLYTLKRDASLPTYLITVQGNATLVTQRVIIDGGAIWNDVSLTVKADTTRTNSGIMADNPLILVDPDGTLTLNDGTFVQNNHNTGSGDCGAIRNSGILTLNNGSLIKLCSFMPSGATSGANAGAICSVQANASVTMNGNASIAGCMSYVNNDKDAGGVFSGQGSVFIMNGMSSIYGCYANNTGGGATQHENKLQMNGSSSIHHCVSRTGGGVMAYAGALIEMNGNASVHNNNSLNTGGGIQLLGGALTTSLRMKDNTAIYNNKTKTTGGGIMNTEGAVYMAGKASVRNNESGTYGGGIFLVGSATAQGRLYLSNGNISHNAAKLSHGGVSLDSHATAHIAGGEVAYNTAVVEGGGVYASGETDTVNVSGGRIIANKAPVAAGLGITNQSVLNMTGGEISDNRATRKAGGLYIDSHATNQPVANVIEWAIIKNNMAPQGGDVYMSADKAGGQPSVFNLGGAVRIEGEIYLEKDTLNPAPSGSPLLNKFITLVSPPSQKFNLVTHVPDDTPYGRIVVVPGTTTVGGNTYTLADAGPHAGKFGHNVKPVVKGLPTTVTDGKLILGCYDADAIEIRRTPLGKPAKVNIPQTFFLANPSSSISKYEWSFPEGTPSSSMAVAPTTTWNTGGGQKLILHIYEKGVSYAPGDTMRCDVSTTRMIQINERVLDFFVDKKATGGNHDGSSWKDAFLNVDDALFVASKGDRIWVAEGVYKPSNGSFVMAYDSVELYGGFAGTELKLEERDIAAHPTVLSGIDSSVIKIDGNQVYAGGGCGISRGARWDGFVITGGKDLNGAGIYNDNGSPTIANCIIRGNVATRNGGGVYTLSRGTCATGSPFFVNTEISGNTARQGGGIYNEGGGTELLNVTISGNQAETAGAGLYNNTTSGMKLKNTLIYDNRTVVPCEFPNIENAGVATEYRFCLIEGLEKPNAWTFMGIDGGHNVSGDPNFVKGGFNAEGRMIAGNYRLKGTRSAAFDAGWNTPIHGYAKDLAWRERLYNGRVDIGAYEFAPDYVVPPVISYSIIVNKYDHVKTSYPKGIHYVVSHKHFTITFIPEEGYTLENMKIKTGSKWQDEMGGMRKVINKDGSVTVTFFDVFEPLDIRLSGVVPTSSYPIDDASAVWADRGLLYVKADRSRLLEIYTVMGTLLHSRNIDAGETMIPLSRGLYIVKIDNMIQKVLVK